MGLGDKWGHGGGTWGGFRGPAWWNETFRVTLGDTGLGHGVGLGDQHGGMRPFRVTLGDTGLGHGVMGTNENGLSSLFEKRFETNLKVKLVLGTNIDFNQIARFCARNATPITGIHRTSGRERGGSGRQRSGEPDEVTEGQQSKTEKEKQDTQILYKEQGLLCQPNGKTI